MVQCRSVELTTLDSARLAALLEAGRGLVAQLEVDAVLEELLRIACVLTGARYAAIGVLDESLCPSAHRPGLAALRGLVTEAVSPRRDVGRLLAKFRQGVPSPTSSNMSWRVERGKVPDRALVLVSVPSRHIP